MSELIRHLTFKAGAKLYTEPSTNDVTGVYMPFESVEMLANLIARECLDIVNRQEYSYHEADPLWETAQLIKARFGIK
jgi:hypothetical protein